jgi:hypothetical protein
MNTFTTPTMKRTPMIPESAELAAFRRSRRRSQRRQRNLAEKRQSEEDLLAFEEHVDRMNKVIASRSASRENARNVRLAAGKGYCECFDLYCTECETDTEPESADESEIEIIESEDDDFLYTSLNDILTKICMKNVNKVARQRRSGRKITKKKSIFNGNFII